MAIIDDQRWLEVSQSRPLGSRRHSPLSLSLSPPPLAATTMASVCASCSAVDSFSTEVGVDVCTQCGTVALDSALNQLTTQATRADNSQLGSGRHLLRADDVPAQSWRGANEGEGEAGQDEAQPGLNRRQEIYHRAKQVSLAPPSPHRALISQRLNVELLPQSTDRRPSLRPPRARLAISRLGTAV